MSELPLVVVADFLEDDLRPERSALDGVARVERLGCNCESELAERAADAEAIMLWHIVGLGDEGLRRLPRCKLVVRMGVGLDNLDVEAATRRGVQVANVPDYGTEDVADSALGMALVLARGIHQANELSRRDNGPWSYAAVKPLHRLRGRTLGLLGMSRIGTAVALRAKAFGMDVVFFDPYLPGGVEKSIGVRRVESLDQLLSQSSLLSLHCLLTPETRHVIDEDALSKLPAGAILINTARGGLVDSGALLAALASGHLDGAGLDVLEQEPPDPKDPLICAWRDPEHPASSRLIINPHVAFYCEESIQELRTKAALACRQAVLGEPVTYTINAAALAANTTRELKDV